MKLSKNYISRFFSKWFYIGIILILLGLVIEQTTITSEEKLSTYAVELLSSLLQSIGVAIFVANIFTFMLGTEEFLSYIRDRLVKIVVSKDFLQRLNSDERKEVLHMVMRPTKELSDVYSGIVRYFDRYIDKSLTLFSNLYRSNLVINTVARYDKNKSTLKLEQDFSFRMYRVDKKFESIAVGFDDERSEHLETRVVTPDGEEEILESSKIESTEKKTDPNLSAEYEQKIPDRFNKHHHLNISRKLVEYGCDHWQLFSYRASRPCDGLMINIYCEDDIEVKTYTTYGLFGKFKIEKSNNHIKIVCNDWLEPGFGVSILLARPVH